MFILFMTSVWRPRDRHTVMALLFTGQYFHEFHEKVAFRENIIVNSYASVAFLLGYILAS